MITLALVASVALVAAEAQAKQKLGPVMSRGSTAYCPCEGSVGRVDARGGGLRWGHVAANGIAYNTLLRMERLARIPGQPPRRYFRVKDVGAPLDIWVPRGWQMNAWGVRKVKFRVVR
jgi:hypothetical protein